MISVFIYDGPTLVFPSIISAFLNFSELNPKIVINSSKWACFMPGKTKIGPSYNNLYICQYIIYIIYYIKQKNILQKLLTDHFI